MEGWNDQVAVIVAGAAGALLLVSFVWLGVLSSKLSKLKKAHSRLIGDTGVSNMEEVMGVIHGRMSELERKQSDQDQTMGQHERRLASLKGRIGVHRFNAFSDSGSDLSFSVAFINEAQDGVVITGIHGREQTFLYAKPIDKGQSAYMLTPEEKTAISLAMQKE
ncbi:hypothetical protein B1A99_20285 [Cohnella sp. CIP 111063]|mgnify:CR=1 FL=1|jgi:hypothetical protein|uniref:DUF4446 family protein n=1 Tax=unclassified Cohnella TaxID=2636738 RepID=UPI000B8C2BD1|nr:MULTISPECIES: DUF4446 family protein [unclassified Cohnella]OXS56654.1 hypothetical protein B1A99_20285 [Cohnella sp. CIP 111063]PRX68851.1 uncharacterized protein DUF4446 [Cohnella sp. SGD-V74]